MKELSLGNKIKEARIAKKMTQSEVVGDFITRNMLSKIENDAAAPSIKTLEYLAEVLDVPLSYFMSSLVANPDNMEGTIGDREKKKQTLVAKLQEKIAKLQEADLVVEAIPGGTAEAVQAIAEEYRETCTQPPDTDDLFCRLMAEYYRIRKEPAQMKPYVAYLSAKSVLRLSDNGYSAYYTGMYHFLESRYTEARRYLEAAQRQCPPKNALLKQIYYVLEQCSLAENDFQAAYQYANKRLEWLEQERSGQNAGEV